jgi:CRP/FNR family cyclic AMP-dependent transcriptional regulator
MATRSEILQTIPLFEGLDDVEREELAGNLEAVQFPPDQLIFAAGDPGDSMYIVTAGEVEIFFKDNTGRPIVLEQLGAGAFFGDLSLLDKGARNASARCVTEVEALRVDTDDLERLVRSYPKAALDLLGAMAGRVRVNAELLRHTASRNANEEIDDNRSAVDRTADWIADFSGSIPFLIIHVVIFAVWIGWNLIPGFAFDPFPYGLLTMVVSLEAIILSVFVLLSQQRQIEKDRVRSEIEYDVNLKAELEIMHLHEKMDRLTGDMLVRLASIEGKLKPAVTPIPAARRTRA